MQMQELTCKCSNSHADDDAVKSHADAGTHIQVQERHTSYTYRCFVIIAASFIKIFLSTV
jgi:hypothetical protein